MAVVLGTNVPSSPPRARRTPRRRYRGMSRAHVVMAALTAFVAAGAAMGWLVIGMLGGRFGVWIG